MKLSRIAGIGIIGASLLVWAGTQIHYIDTKDCTQCGICIENCPVEAIELVKKDGKEIHVINTKLCTQCGECIENCPVEAIKVKESE